MHSYAAKPQELGHRPVHSDCYLQADQANHVDVQPRKGFSTAANRLVRIDDSGILDAKSLVIWRSSGASLNRCFTEGL
jgi:hypothetical protein